MSTSRTKNRKKRESNNWILSKSFNNRLFKALFLSVIFWLIYTLILSGLNQKIKYISIESSFQNVKENQIKDAIFTEIENGILNLDTSELYSKILDIEWIDKVSISRKWPDRLELKIYEHHPVARWGDNGLLNNRGELFTEITNQNLIPSNLSQLNGPNDKSYEVAQRYLSLKERLVPYGINITAVDLDKRGAWRIKLYNGTVVNFGKKDVKKRFDLFVDIAKNIISSESDEIESIDMRYDNGFTLLLKK